MARQSVVHRQSPAIQPDRLYTYREAGELLGVTRHYVKNAVHDDRIPSVKLNARGVRRVRGRDLLTWLDEGGVV